MPATVLVKPEHAHAPAVSMARRRHAPPKRKKSAILSFGQEVEICFEVGPMPARFRVLLTDYAWPDVSIERDTLAEIDAELIVAPQSDMATLVELAQDVEAILTCWARVTPEVIDAAPRLQIIARLGIGLDNIALEHAARRGVLVTNVPDYCLTEVAEHTLALLLALARRVALFHLATKQGRYALAEGLPLRRLAGQTLGIIGLGQIGRRVAELARGVGLRVVATGRTVVSVPGVEWLPLDDLLAQSDFVSLHVPSTSDTRHLINASSLARMKPGSFLINTSRGAVVDEAALAASLAEGHLAGAALDVQATEPPRLDQPPFNDPRVIVTPHAAFVSTESVAELRLRAARQVVDALAGRTPPHVVVPRRTP